MKKFISIIIMLAVLLTATCAHADGCIYSTDIKAYIDYMWVPTYNYDGTTVVVVRDLENYGYNVEWNEAQKRVDLYKNTSKPQTPHVPNYYAPKDIGKKLFDVYPSDIKVFFGGIQIPSANVGGKTVVKLRDIDIRCNIEFDPYVKSVNMFVSREKLSGEKLEYINKFYEVLSLISRGDYERMRIESMLTGGVYSESFMNIFKAYIEEVTDITDEFKKYDEPDCFFDSSMELWWALVNSRYASCTLYDMGLNLKHHTDNPSLSVYLAQYSLDSYNQRDNAMTLLAKELAAIK